MIKWISNDIGTGAFDEVSESTSYIKIDVRFMVDKEGNDLQKVKNSIDNSILKLENNKIVICCDYGMSRSNSIAVGVIAKSLKLSFTEALKIVLEKTKEKNIKLEVLNVVRLVSNDDDNKSKKPSILITGGSGFIGQALIKKLSSFNVVSLTSLEINLETDIVLLDIFVKEHNVTTIIHLANPRIYTTNISMSATLLMLKNVLDVSVGNNLKLIYLSGWEVYSGYATSGMMVSENVKALAKGTYGLTKSMCENLINSYIDIFKIKSLIIRPSPVYGEGSDKPKFIYNFLSKALKNQEIITHKYINDYPALDLMHIDDLIDFLEQCIIQNTIGEYNIGTGVLTSTKDIANKIKNIVDSSSNISHVEINQEIANIAINTDKAKKDIGFKAKISIDEGLIKLCKENIK